MFLRIAAPSLLGGIVEPCDFARLQEVDPENQSSKGELTNLLQMWSAGDERAFDQLIPLVYDELHRMALRYLAGERANVSLPPTALVNEVCLRLLGWDEVRWKNRGHFFGVSAH